MKKTLSLALSAFLVSAGGVIAGNAPEGPAIQAMGAYVPTDDLEGSEAFYRTLFDRAPVIELDDFVAFDISGGWFAIVSRARYAPGTVPGTGAVPYLQSSDLQAVRSRISSTGATAPDIIEEPGIHILKVTDPEGQLIEFFMLTNG